MNNNFKNINIEDVIFWDLELVRRSEELDINSREFELYQKKIRNKDTDELLPAKEVQEHYKKFGALKLGYNKIVCAVVGGVREGKLYLRTFTGTEEEILRNIYTKFQSAKYLSGYNTLYFDGVMARVNSLRYEGVAELIPEPYNDSGKKQWELKNIIDLMDVIKGTHWSNLSLDEVCYILGIDSPKDDIDGSQVSEVYYNEGVDRIAEYCRKDVFAVVNIFLKLQGKEVFKEYIDANSLQIEEKEVSLLGKIYNTNSFSPEVKEILKKKKIDSKDKEAVKKIILAHYQSKTDKVADKKRKEQEVDEFIKSL